MKPVASPEHRAAAWLQAWDSQGYHRTATPGDEAGADWLRAAAETELRDEVFSLDRLDPLDAFVDIDGVRVHGEPMFDAPDTPEGGVTGRHGRDVAIHELSPQAVYGAEFRAMRQASRQGALVIVTRGERPGLAMINAEGFSAPYGPPILQVGSEHASLLRDAVAKHAEFRVVLRSRRTRAQARNLVVTLPGRSPERPPLVVMTPRSSWFQSTSERGGGLVCWLECLAALRAAPRPAMDVVFTANSGHELGHLGLDAFVARRPVWETAATWIHFGANIGAAGGKLRLMSGTEALRERAAEALDQAGRAADEICPPTLVPSGETRDIHRAGGQYLTIVGTNPLFHLAQDRWPDSVDLAAITRTAQGAAAFVLALSRD